MFAKDERGAVRIIEAALVYPAVIITVTALIYLGINVFESAMLSDRARITAVMAARNIAFSGYHELGDVYSGYDFAGSSGPSASEIRKMYISSRPYRYIIPSETDRKFSEGAEKYASELVYTPDSAECTIYTENSISGRKVKVSIVKDISLPGVIKLSGADERYRISVSASAFTSDPAEFVRNTDLVMDVSEETGLTEKISELRSAVSGLLKGRE